MNIYYIGGSPCAGKSTVAEILAKEHGLYYFKVDDFLDDYTKIGAIKGYPVCKKTVEWSAEQIWMREPLLQCDEEFAFYEEVFEYVCADLEKLKGENGIITEGAAYVPKLMKNLGVSRDRYISITPTPDFQVSHFKEREFVPYVLEGCNDKEKAFSNWMGRDILFAQEVQKQCYEEGYVSIVNAENIGVDELVNIVSTHFGLKKLSSIRSKKQESKK